MAQIDSAFGYKSTWFSVKDVMPDMILASCPNFTKAVKIKWEEGLMAAVRSVDKVPYIRPL